MRDEPQIHGATARDGSNSSKLWEGPDGSDAWDGEGEGGALFRPDRLSGRSRRTRGEK